LLLLLFLQAFALRGLGKLGHPSTGQSEEQSVGQPELHEERSEDMVGQSAASGNAQLRMSLPGINTLKAPWEDSCGSGMVSAASTPNVSVA